MFSEIGELEVLDRGVCFTAQDAFNAAPAAAPMAGELKVHEVTIHDMEYWYDGIPPLRLLRELGILQHLTCLQVSVYVTNRDDSTQLQELDVVLRTVSITLNELYVSLYWYSPRDCIAQGEQYLTIYTLMMFVC